MFYNFLNFISKLTFGKVYNVLKSNISFFLSKILNKSILWGVPYSYSVEPTSVCNLKCPQCPTGKGILVRKNKEIRLELYHSFIDKIADSACYLALYLQGEPFLNKNIFAMIKYANTKNIYTSLSTNGHFLQQQNAIRTIDAGLNRIIISLDGTDDYTYSQYRIGGNIQVVLEGVKNLVEAKKIKGSKNPFITLQFIVFKHNQHQIRQFKKLGKSLGVDKTELKSAQLDNFQQGHPMMTQLRKFSRYKKNGNLYSLKKKLSNHCKRIWTVAAVTCDGVLTSCCYDKNTKYNMGNLESQEIYDLWKGNKFMHFRKKIINNQKEIDICKNCNQ